MFINDLTSDYPNINLELKNDRDRLASYIKKDINNYCQTKYENDHRVHLGASLMGEPCSRKLFYTFRWVKKQIFEGRILRLFNVGHEAEPRFVDYLRGIGFKVDPVDPITGNQFRISSCLGHYGGSLDGICKAPSKYNISENLLFLNEFKTNNTGAGYNNVSKDGVFKAKPKHYIQMCQYGKFYNLKYGLYLIENKNDSDITIQIVPLDWSMADQAEKRASDIIFTKFPPSRISENPSYIDCKTCEYSGICHDNEKVEINCRSCKFSEPVKNAKWFCNRWKQEIPEEAIVKGCEYHLSVNV